jgi:hypothetical protein
MKYISDAGNTSSQATTIPPKEVPTAEVHDALDESDSDQSDDKSGQNSENASDAESEEIDPAGLEEQGIHHKK